MVWLNKYIDKEYINYNTGEELSVIYNPDLNSLPTDFPTFTFEGESISHKDILITCLKSPYLICLDYKGNVKWYKRFNHIIQEIKQIDDYNYSLLLVEGYFNEYPLIANYEKCSACIYNLKEDKCTIIKALKYGSIKEDNYKLENHLFYALTPTHYFVSTLTITENNKINNIIQEQKDGKVVWQFETKDYPELIEWSHFSAKNQLINEDLDDYAHLNSMCIDLDGNIVLSFRNIGLIKINYNTKQIMWCIGRKKLYNILTSTPTSWLPKYQHSLSIDEKGNYYVYDNAGGEYKARILKFSLEGNYLTCNLYNTLDNINYQLGSVQKINNNTFFICSGLTIYDHNFISELTYSQNQIKTNLKIKFDDELVGYSCYRGL